MKIVLLGCNHRTAPVDLRERLAFDGGKLAAALAALAQQFPEVEFVLINTCNRVELYAASEHPGLAPDSESLTRFLGEFHQLDPQAITPHLYHETDRSAVLHLFCVAASLDSLVPGEGQILGQVKGAYELARERGLTGPLTNTLFQRAFAVGKKVHTTTEIAQRKVSVSSVAVEFACEIFEASQFPNKTVLVIGAGKMGELTLEHLCALKPGRILVTNRNPQKALDVATRWRGEAVQFAELHRWLAEADLILSTTGAPEPVVDRETFRNVMARRGNRAVFIIDIAVPRDFSSDVGELDNVYLYNIDDLERQRAENLQAREQEVLKGTALVERETELFLKDLDYQRHTGPVITQLRREWDQVRESELSRLFSQCPNMSEQDRKAIQHGFERFQNQLLHLPLSTLRTATAANGPPHGLLDALRRLFHLG